MYYINFSSPFRELNRAQVPLLDQSQPAVSTDDVHSAISARHPTKKLHHPTQVFLTGSTASRFLLEGPKPATRGGEWEPIKISSEIQTVGLYPENHPNPQTF